MKFKEMLGTSSVLITDGQGNTGVDEQGNILTTIINITEAPTIDIEPAKTEWKNTQGGSSNDKYEDVVLTSDGGYVKTNVTSSRDGDFAEFKEMGLSAPYSVLTKYNKDGAIEWRKVLGSTKGSLELVALAPADKGAVYAVGYGKAIEDYKTDNLRMFADGYGGQDNATSVANSKLESVGDYVYFIAAPNANNIEAKILEMIK
jgi:hypothetical protein